ncbi:hypothetical protein I5G60_gp25 [Mycobacterium phage Saguaro]|uniref:Tail assembly chaperone n=1 Tax=Mycobacterium phage Saguaro TaxID=2315616 RepID=A0A386KCT6_9CAUD|nr:hypothetical protein I5G60_gp25 [Mycobacterium phage Saguaro]AYD82020.1 hypothetical protein SEA_SAGUARO_25 [Mycobacterium phage Saguaro]
MAKITIEGSLTPAAGLARGERREVQDSAEVREYVRRGFAVVVDEESGQPEPAPLPEPVSPPARNASRDDWAEWLAEHTDVVTEGKDRGELIESYDAWQARHDRPAETED